ncbi:amidohydrolase [Ponticoccus sp. SC2-23]|uniref:amidohydrolase n=1 Tax=Alexandriicola marinus TaxID=2081710 RepID=UPI000FD9750E|nr:amidohydrolase [Alexandriicola marinus]MBM1220956.1 amidohydrolase [Ponticoccus sp. SC6-9]MBM1225526.1 amidohydrolase [Ponticoccus sp. SC6-15]MBM1227709.1 amidohydrolase [Ponticoccus sp. SC6-38]MBM1234653.1 amidohydrolase [Ponticoccus sp. SC6-45]MBM1238211.1 amidohydrolase [Ponticoccus sp. SC6-49]MBM1244156.1 amidohydrolase [Ponticoccus sp. SC2-64]MBM1248177.1 amidohydrolase [Ponticoccus sp. SC6-42]MBM1252611.1 amidohydrolase [Ponticoccus sp. SC6-33]MBM1256220.1 amidohydrolase [Ponticoc
MTDQAQIAHLTDLRHALHTRPEISGEERETAQRIVAEIQALGADRIWRGIGGHGVAAEFRGAGPGPTVLLRCELDGLPIRELSDLPYKSLIDGRGHLCGHDGHMVTLLGVAMRLAIRPPRGRVILLFQPAEETGAGAKAVVEDAIWPEIRPDFAFAYHNVPGRPLGEIGLRPGPGNCASRGMQIRFEGKSAHAAAPQDGLSPGPAMAALMTALPALGEGTLADPDFALSTLTHAHLGEPTFGIAPAEGELRVTLRTMTNARMEALIAAAEAELARAKGDLHTEVHWHDIFHAVTNDVEATAIARDAARSLGQVISEMETPMSWSEDFGRIGEDGAKAAMLYVGAGETRPKLHNPDYDFPDGLLPIMIDLFCAIVDHILGPRVP